jgi:hypothetical protein
MSTLDPEASDHVMDAQSCEATALGRGRFLSSSLAVAAANAIGLEGEQAYAEPAPETARHPFRTRTLHLRSTDLPGRAISFDGGF